MLLNNLCMKSIFKVLIIVLTFYSCTPNNSKKEPITQKDTSLSSVIKTKELRVIFNFNSADYYIDRATPVGFQLDLINHYCHYMNIKLKPIVRDNIGQEFISLAKNEADLIVGDLNYTPLRGFLFNFSISHSRSPLVLVKRREADPSKSLVAGSRIDVHIPSHTSYAEYIDAWAIKKGIKANIVFNNDYTSENLLERVSLGEIDYTVVDKKVALNNARLLTNIDFSRTISPPLYQSWVFPKSSDSLRMSINVWLAAFLKTDTYKNIYTRYFNTTFHSQILQNRKSYTKSKSISRWDKTIKIAARKNGWDWKLYAALIYQESGFIPSSIGNGGSFGLLQLMPATGRTFGVSMNSPPEVQILKGANYVKFLEKIYKKKVKNKEQLSKFVLASYNSGPGHVIDAINLTKKYGKDPTRWDDNVEDFLRLKSVPKYYNDPIVKNGYYRGAYTVKFVDDVWDRYQHYKNFVN